MVNEKLPYVSRWIPATFYMYSEIYFLEIKQQHLSTSFIHLFWEQKWAKSWWISASFIWLQPEIHKKILTCVSNSTILQYTTNHNPNNKNMQNYRKSLHIKFSTTRVCTPSLSKPSWGIIIHFLLETVVDKAFVAHERNLYWTWNIWLNSNFVLHMLNTHVPLHKSRKFCVITQVRHLSYQAWELRMWQVLFCQQKFF